MFFTPEFFATHFIADNTTAYADDLERERHEVQRIDRPGVSIISMNCADEIASELGQEVLDSNVLPGEVFAIYAMPDFRVRVECRHSSSDTIADILRPWAVDGTHVRIIHSGDRAIVEVQHV